MKPELMHVDDSLIEESEGPVGALIAAAYAVGCRQATVRGRGPLVIDLWWQGQPRPLLLHPTGPIANIRGYWALPHVESGVLEKLLQDGFRPGLVVAHGLARYSGRLYRTGANTADVIAAYLRFASWARAREGLRESHGGWSVYEEVTTSLAGPDLNPLAEWFRLGNYVGDRAGDP